MHINTDFFQGFSDFTEEGRGSFGIVYAAKHNKTNLNIAIKYIDPIDLMAKSNRDVFQAEYNIISKIDHPFLPQFIGKIEDKKGTYLIMEHLPNGTLLNFIKQDGKIREPIAQRMFCQIASALLYLHEECQVVHRDIKVENILLDKDMNIRIIDFGLAGQLSQKQLTLSEQCGSWPYVAPEIVRGNNYSKSVDVWATGVVLYLMLTGSFPFQGKNSREVFNNICHQEVFYPKYLSRDVIDILKRMLDKNPESRITFKELATHPWVVSSRYCYFCSPTFTQDLNSKINTKNTGLNESIVNNMTNLGIDITNLKTDIEAGRATEATMIYKIQKKNMQMIFLRSTGQIRRMYSTKKTMELSIPHHLPVSQSPSPAQIRKGSTFAMKTKSRCVSLELSVPNRTIASTPLRHIQ